MMNKKERVFDVVLTNKGRELLSKNKLKFRYYAFSDEGINYSGSWSASSSSIDDNVFRNIAFEADQRHSGKGNLLNTDLKSFLFTVPSRSEIQPQLYSNYDDGTTLTLTRRYMVSQLDLTAKDRTKVKETIALVMRGTISKRTFNKRMASYVADQQFEKVTERLADGKSVIGHKMSENFLIISKTKVLDTQTGAVFSFDDIFDVLSQPVGTGDTPVLGISEEVEEVIGLETNKIEFKLKTVEGQYEAPSGFLIEVFLSGADGKLIRLGKESVEDPLNDDTLEEGFDSFLELEVDK